MKIEEKAKELAAIATLASVIGAILGGVATLTKLEWLPNSAISMFVALAAAIVGATTSLLVTRSLRARRTPKRVFLIYSRKDLAVAKELSALLTEAGFAPWLDVEQLVPGQVWRQAIVRAIQEAGVAVVLISKSLSESRESQAELMAAMKILTAKDKHTFPVLPVRLDDSEVPKFLSHVQWVNWHDSQAKEQILLGLEHATGYSPRTRPSPPADSAA